MQLFFNSFSLLPHQIRFYYILLIGKSYYQSLLSISKMARAIWFFIKILKKLLSIMVIVCKDEVDVRILINMIFLNYSQYFYLLMGVYYFGLD